MIDSIRNLFKNKNSSKLTAEETQEANAAATKFLEEQSCKKPGLPTYEGLERFEILEKIGDGAFSNVFKARDRHTGKLVAIKVAQKRELNDKNNTHLHPSLKRRTKATERANILKEVQIMRGVNHPNIVKLVHFSESHDYYYLVLELCQGGELFHQIVKLTYFSEDLARHVICQVAAGVRYLHEECGVVHRDIKPENILIDPIPIIPSKHKKMIYLDDEDDKEDEGEFVPGKGGGGIGTVKLADFGLSKVIWDEKAKTPCGTLSYTAPEMISDQHYSKSVDMWALGCVLYTMLCGFPPFYDESIRTLQQKVVRGEYSFLSPWWDPISASAKDLVSHLLCVDPKERYSIDEFFTHPWILQGMTGGVDPVAKLHRKTDPRTQAMQNAAVSAQRRGAPGKDNHDHPLLHHSTFGGSGSCRKADASLKEEAKDEYRPLQTPGNHNKRQELFTPGIASLKEVLDITYAVQRMGEESPRPRASGIISWAEDDYDDDDLQQLQQQQHLTISNASDSLTSSSTLTSHSSIPSTADGLSDELVTKAEQLALDGKGFAHAPAKGSATTSVTSAHSKHHYYHQHLSTPTSHRKKPLFQLNMNDATLLKNRRLASPPSIPLM